MWQGQHDFANRLRTLDVGSMLASRTCLIACAHAASSSAHEVCIPIGMALSAQCHFRECVQRRELGVLRRRVLAGKHSSQR